MFWWYKGLHVEVKYAPKRTYGYLAYKFCRGGACLKHLKMQQKYFSNKFLHFRCKGGGVEGGVGWGIKNSKNIKTDYIPFTIPSLKLKKQNKSI